MPVDPSKFDAVVSAIEKKYEGELRNGSDYEHPQRISTRSPALDVATGGGIPIGRFSRLYGPYSSTKTLTCWNVVAEAQEMGLSCCYWNIEKSYDVKFVEHLGVDTDNLLIMEGTEVEAIAEKLEAMLSVVHVHVLDSCSAAVSRDELNADAGQWLPGIRARAWGRAWSRIQERFDHVENTIILVDQLRRNIKTSANEPPGGQVMDFISSMNIRFNKGKKIFRNEHGFLDPKASSPKGKDWNTEEFDGREINARVEKSRVGRPELVANMRWGLDNLEFDRVYEYAELATKYGVIEDRGGGNYYYPATGENKTRLWGVKAFYEFILGDLTLQEEIVKTAVERARDL